MGYDLRRGLEAITSGTPVPTEPVSPERVVTRVRRRRVLRTGAVTAAAAAAVLVGAVVVQAAPWQTDPVPPAMPSPTASPSAAPTQSPAPTLSPEPTPQVTVPAPEPDAAGGEPVVALTASGDLVELDLATGVTTRTVAAGVVPAGTRTPLEIDPERTWVYLATPPDVGASHGQVVRVSLLDGAVEEVAVGHSPALSPDGRTLAVVVRRGSDGWGPPQVELIDLADGSITASIPDDGCEGGCFMRAVGNLEWSADGTEVYVAEGWADSPVATVIRALTVADGTPTATVSAGRRVGPEEIGELEPAQSSWSRVERVGDGRVVIGGLQLPDDVTTAQLEAGAWDDGAFVAIVDGATGQVLHERRVPDMFASALSASPTGTEVLFVDVDDSVEDPTASTGTLHRWVVATGEVVEVAADIVSVAW